MLCHARGPKLKLRRKKKEKEPSLDLDSDSSVRDSGIIYDESTSPEVSEKIPEPVKPLLPNKYTSRDKSLRLNHGGWERNDKEEKEFSAASYPSIREVLRLGGPYPQTIRSSYNDFWFRGFHDQSPYSWVGDPLLQAVSNPALPVIETQCEETTYRKHYIGQEHLNFYGRDDEHGPIMMSIKVETEKYRVIIRCRDGNFERWFELEQDNSGPLIWARSVIPNINMKSTRFYPVLCFNAWQRILTFDEHANMKKNHKFAVFFQTHGQTTEDELLGNKYESKRFKTFLNEMGTIVKLSDHAGFRGGLTSAGAADGERSLYTKYDSREIMFHVSTMLPTDAEDKQQVAKKRHLGNDVVAIIFQDTNTPFCPSLMQTKVTHCYIVVQPMEIEGPTQYKISVCCRKDVPEFSPQLPEPPVFKSGDSFRNFLLCMLINAETACYSSSDFHMLRRRNRSDLIETLHDELSNASDGLSTKRNWIQRPLQTHKSFFDTLQASQKLRRLSSSDQSSESSEAAREQKNKIQRRSGIRRELNAKYQLKINDSGISSRDSSSSDHDSNIGEEISDAVTERDMESLKSEMYSVKDQDGKLSLYDSVSQSIGDISSRMTSLKLKRTPTDRQTAINQLVNDEKYAALHVDFPYNHVSKSFSFQNSNLNNLATLSSNTLSSSYGPTGFAQATFAPATYGPTASSFGPQGFAGAGDLVEEIFNYSEHESEQFTEISDISSVVSSVAPVPCVRKLPAGAVAMPHMMAW